MASNPREMQNTTDNPAKVAAFHFGAYLQLKGLLRGSNKKFGNIELNQLNEQFINHYQPQFRSCLVLPQLLSTLCKYHVVLQSTQKKQQRASDTLVRVVKRPNPEQVRAPGIVHRHLVYVDQTGVLREEFARSCVINETHCRLCQVTFAEQEKQSHVESDIHIFRLQYREKRNSFKSTVGGSSIAVMDMENCSQIILRENEERCFTVRVTLDQTYTTAEIFKIIILQDKVEATPTEFSNGMPIEIQVTAKFTDPGAYIYPLVAKIKPANICLLLDLIFRVESELIDQLAPVSPYKKTGKNVVRQMEGSILPGEQLPKADFNLVKKVSLGEHKVQPLYNKLMRHKLEKYENMPEHEKKILKKVLNLLCGQKSYQDALQCVSQTKAPYTEPLRPSNYSERYSLLVDLEELQQLWQIRSYDRADQKLQRRNTKFFLKVQDLSEGRPSVNKGDKVNLRLQNDDKFTYEAIVHEIHEQGLLLGLHTMFSEEYNRLTKDLGKEPTVDVCFTINRFPILNMHRALSLISKHEAHSIVFPEQRESSIQPTNPPTLRPWVNPLIGNNPEQQRAIQNIIGKSSGKAPYLIFGPPGTGKTVTLAETIVQVWLSTQTQVAYQLVCAPSNAACNNIAERIIDMLPPSAKILRLFSLSSEEIQIPATLRTHSNYDKKSRCIYMPTIDEITAHHIIVTSIVTAGRLVTGGAGGRFQYVYIDECGQASEPEALIGVAGIITSSKNPNMGQLVLAGDPEQLGPVLCSQVAKDFGLGVSLLERLMKHNELYRKKEDSGYDSKYLTKLVQNFRSHPAILHIPNVLFYDSELEVRGNSEIINKALSWKELPNRKCPLIFHGIQGVDERESNSPSYFNRQEIEVVVTYMKKLFTKGLPNNYKVTTDDIGVITPYRKQVQKFRKMFDLLKWKNIKVGSVEEFQGSEKLIIFISTVRSSISLVEEDYRYKLGFLQNPKRFNVSVTRAQALLIVVGNPNILRHDKQWYQLLNYCRTNGAATGIPFPNDPPPEYQQEHVIT